MNKTSRIQSVTSLFLLLLCVIGLIMDGTRERSVHISAWIEAELSPVFLSKNVFVKDRAEDIELKPVSHQWFDQSRRKRIVYGGGISPSVRGEQHFSNVFGFTFAFIPIRDFTECWIPSDYSVYMQGGSASVFLYRTLKITFLPSSIFSVDMSKGTTQALCS